MKVGLVGYAGSGKSTAFEWLTGEKPDPSKIQQGQTAMADVPPVGPAEYLRTQAVSRLYLDNVPNIQSSWVTQGLKIGQLALLYGANDMGSLMLEENVVSAAGTVHHLTLEEIRAAIREVGYEPRQRNVFYQLVEPAPATRPPASLLPILAS